MDAVAHLVRTALPEAFANRGKPAVRGQVATRCEEHWLGDAEAAERRRCGLNAWVRPFGENDAGTLGGCPRAQRLAEGHSGNRTLSAAATSGETRPSSRPPKRATSRTIDDER